MDKYFTTYTPRVRAMIRPLDASHDNGVDYLHDLSSDLMSISTNKAWGRCSGTWQMILAHTPKNGTQPYSEILTPGMVVTIEMDAGNGAGYFPVMLGLIDRVSAVRQGGAVPQRAVKLSGRDMGKLLEVHDIAFDILAFNEEIKTQDGGSKTVPTLSRVMDPTIAMGTPAEIINRAYELCITNMKMPLAKRIVFVSDCQDSHKLWQPNLMTTAGTSFWSFIKRVERAPFNVLSTDTTLGDVNSFKIVLEQQPFDPETGRVNRPESRWHTIDDTEIIADDLGVSDQERVNFLSYQPLLYVESSVMTYDVMMAHPDLTHMEKADILEQGLSTHIVKDTFTPPEMNAIRDAEAGHAVAAINTAKASATTLWNWYKNNHKYESGTTVVHLRPDIRTGSGLLIKRGTVYFEYFVEQVSHQCQFGTPPLFTTTLHLTRGQKATPKNAEQAAPPEPIKPEPKEAYVTKP